MSANIWLWRWRRRWRWRSVNFGRGRGRRYKTPNRPKPSRMLKITLMSICSDRLPRLLSPVIVGHPRPPTTPPSLAIVACRFAYAFIYSSLGQSVQTHTHSHHTLTLIVFQLLILIWFLILILIVILNYNWQQEAEEAEAVVRCSGVALGDWSNCSKSIFVPMCRHCISADFDYTTQHNCGAIKGMSLRN